MRRKSHLLFLLLAVSAMFALTACAIPEETTVVPTPEPTAQALPEITPAMLGIFGTLPEEATPTGYEMTEPLIDLGRMLYYEPRISINGNMSCNTCHGLNNYGIDGLRFSFGHAGNPVGRNSPSVYNAALHVSQFWDGRAADVEEQAKGPILASGEMGMPSPDSVVAAVKSIPGYLPYFEAAFPGESDPITYDNIGQAIGAFERRLMTPGRFDQFLAGDETALTEREQKGLALFIQTGCVGCHNGPTLGGNSYATLGSLEPYTTNDTGRYAVTGNESDMYVFKVPGLRNVAVTGPYLHDGSIPTMESMVQLMVRHQLGRELSSSQVDDIVVFLRSLTGELPSEYTAEPELPPSE
ncbi:MAG: cytochrome-c peroxidase [Anaerolineae bacterium]|nr:MAG: cytochrome-c peroxidase [Anaerolineae bacterium]